MVDRLFDIANNAARRLGDMFDVAPAQFDPLANKPLGSSYDPLANKPFSYGFDPLAGKPFGTTADPLAGKWFGPSFDPFANKPYGSTIQGQPVPVGGGLTVGAGAAGGAGGYTGTGTASDNAHLTGQQLDQYIASKFANSPLVGKGQLILDYANQKGVSAPEALAIFWKESGMGTTAGPTWNLAGVGGAGGFHQYSNVDDAIRDAIDNLGSDLYRGKSVQDHIGYWFVGPQRYAQSGLSADDGTGGRNGTVGDYLNNFVAPTFAALGVGYNPAGAPTAAAAGPGRQSAGNAIARAQGLIGTPYQLGGLRTHPGVPNAGLDCSELTGYALGLDPSLWNAQAQHDHAQQLDPSQVQAGDLVFFSGTDPSNNQPITHVGLYIGNGQMIDAEDGGVLVANLNSQYWSSHLAGYGRL